MTNIKYPYLLELFELSYIFDWI